jgi:hypothetical protein
MSINPEVQGIITNYIITFLNKHSTTTVEEVIQNFEGPTGIMEWEIRLVINEMVRNGELQVTKKGHFNERMELHLGKISTPVPEEGVVNIVISRPRLRELGFFSIQERNHYLETSQCYKTIIESSRRVLRICSPFLSQDVINADAFPELKSLLLNAMHRGVNIRLLSRELFTKRSSQLKWLLELAKSPDNVGKLSVVDYHLSENRHVFSSTHAKILAADHTCAYIGSAELRRNSIIANFEIGCYLTGPQVVGICEAFDLMFENGRLWWS